MSGVDFGSEIFSMLSEGGKQEHSQLEHADYRFPLWDILREIDRRTRRAGRDKGRDIRDYMGAHPDVVEKIREGHGL